MRIASSFFVLALVASLGSAASALTYQIDQGVDPNAAVNKPKLTVMVAGMANGATFSIEEARGKTVNCSIDVSGANRAYCSTGYHVYYSNRLSLKKIRDKIAVSGGALRDLSTSVVEDTKAPQGWKGLHFVSAGREDVGYDGSMWEFSFTLPDDLQGGEVFPIDILYNSSFVSEDMFGSASYESAESKNMEAYLFTKGIYSDTNPNNFGIDGLPADADGYIAIAVPPPVVSNVVARQRWPWNGLVDVDYEIGGETKGFKAEISFDEQGGAGRHWTATSFLAGAEPTLKAGRNRATWNAKAQGITNVVTGVKATVKLLKLPKE